MYRVANTVTPEDLEAIATQLFVEMLEAGYTSVCEFHYLHHDIDGRPYDDRATLARVIVRAAERTAQNYGGFARTVSIDSISGEQANAVIRGTLEINPNNGQPVLALVQGVAPPLATSVFWLATHFAHPDNFLYIVIKAR